MAGSVNKVILIGNLGRDPEVRSTQAGKKIVNLALATSETWRDRNSGERQERTEWHRVVIFSEGLAKVAEQYLRKGSKVYLEGQLQTRKWQAQDGSDRYTTEVVLSGFGNELKLLDPRRDGPGAPSSEDDYGTVRSRDDEMTRAIPAGQGGGRGPAPMDFDDEIPF